MRAADQEVLAQVASWLAAGRDCWLATVVATWGSSPRPVGSLLACDRDGRMVGSLSGGCVEDDLLEQLTAGSLAAEAATIFEYGVTPEETERLGLPCGGRLTVYLEPLRPARDEALVEEFQQLTTALAERRWFERLTGPDGHRLTELTWDPERAVVTYDEAGKRFRQVFGPRKQLFIIGAGMVSHYLAEMALMLDFAVTVCDPREHLLEAFPVADVKRLAAMPDDAIRASASDSGSAIVALTHDPRIDDMGLLEALATDAFYIGAMGSSRTSANRRERLALLGVDHAALDRLHAPIGLDLGSKTPPEIAVAIIAELIAVTKAQQPLRRQPAQVAIA
ncbi:MAG: XdhC family protein [Pseudomonadota bacterium]